MHRGHKHPSHLPFTAGPCRGPRGHISLTAGCYSMPHTPVQTAECEPQLLHMFSKGFLCDTVFTLYSRLYNRLGELCKWVQASSARAVQPGQCGAFHWNLWNDWTDWACFHISCNVLQENRVPTKIRVVPSGTLHQTPDLDNFASAYRSSRCVIDLARERWTLRAL